MKISRALVLLVLTLLPSAAAAQSTTTFAAVPCPQQTWEFSDPAFTPLPGARAYFGRYEGGLYQIEVPANWNGELVLYAHGLVAATNPLLRVQTPLLRTHWISRGFAWAASSYRCNGGVYGVPLLDTLALPDLVASVQGARMPSRTYLVGQSLGGRIAILGLREFPRQVAGAMAMCSMGQETNDFWAAMAAAAQVITGVTLDADRVDEGLLRMEKIVGTAADYTEKGRQLAGVQIASSGGPRPFAVEGLRPRLLPNVRNGITSTPDFALRAATSQDLVYAIEPGLGLSADQLNREVARKAPEGNLRSQSGPYRELLPFDGKLEKPLLTIHGTGDLQIPVSQQQAFARATRAAGTGHLLVQRLMRIPGHCQFSEAEQIAAFDDLVTWVQRGTRPEGDDVLGDLTDAGRRFTTPLRAGDPGTVSAVAAAGTTTK